MFMDVFIKTDSYIRSQEYINNSELDNWILSERYIKQLCNGVKWFNKIKDKEIGILYIDFNTNKVNLHLNDGRRRHFILSLVNNKIYFTNYINTLQIVFELPLEKGMNRSIKEEQIGDDELVYRYLYIE